MKKLIHGAQFKTLKPIPDERGFLMEILRADDSFFRKFGQIYLTAVNPGVVKAWHFHKKQTDHFCVVKGMAKIVLYDPRRNSPTRGMVNEFFCGELAPGLVAIPPMVYHGFKGISVEPALIINVPTETYNYRSPDEFRLPAHTKRIPYTWARKDG